MSRSDDENDGQATERVVIRDRRKIDVKGKDTKVADVPKESEESVAEAEEELVAGAHRAEEAEDEAPAPASPALGAELAALRTELDERTRDLQRVTAEYANYRKRVDRDRSVAAEQTTGSVLIGAAAGARRHRPGARARRPGRAVRLGRRDARRRGRQARAGRASARRATRSTRPATRRSRT